MNFSGLFLRNSPCEWTGAGMISLVRAITLKIIVMMNKAESIRNVYKRGMVLLKGTFLKVISNEKKAIIVLHSKKY